MVSETDVRVATLELLVKTLMLTMINSSKNPNVPQYIWNTFENSLDAHTVKGADELEAKEVIRKQGQDILQSVLIGAGLVPPSE